MRLRSYLLVSAAGALLLGPLACQQPARTTALPGSLPHSQFDGVQPRIDAATLYAHGNLLERQGNLDGALMQYQRALAVDPNSLAARNRLGIVLNKLGRHAEATAAFEAAVKASPNSAYLYNNLGFSLYLEGKFTAARAMLERALELRADFARARMNYAVVLAKLGEPDAALAQFRHAVGEVDAYYNLALVETEAGRFGAAVHALDRALALDANFEPARQHLRTVARLAAEQDARTSAAATPQALTGTAPDATQSVADTGPVDTTPPAPPSPNGLTRPAPPTVGGPMPTYSNPAGSAPGAGFMRRWMFESRPTYFSAVTQ